MRKLFISILIGGGLLLCAQAPDPEPTKVLFNRGVREEQRGRLDSAKLFFVTLVRTYDESSYVSQAKAEIGAIAVYQEAQAKQAAGDLRAAFDTYQTLVLGYRESALAAAASKQMRLIDPEGKWTRR